MRSGHQLLPAASMAAMSVGPSTSGAFTVIVAVRLARSRVTSTWR